MFRLFFSKLIICFLVSPVMYVFSAEENFLLINGLTDEILIELGTNNNKRFSPCCSFNIALSLMGYHCGILENEEMPKLDFKDGYDDWADSWKTAQTPKTWMKFSCVWYSKLLALQLGLESIQKYLVLFDYGNKDTSAGLVVPGPLSPAWLNSSLQISPHEQVAFIQKMLLGKLPISGNAIQQTKAILFNEQLPGGWNLYGKTGWSGSPKNATMLEHAWFVGWIEKDNTFYPFAYLIRDKKINLTQRLRVKELLAQYSILSA